MKMNFPFQISLCHVFSEYMARMVYFQNPWSGSCTFKSTFSEAPFGRETCFPKYPLLCSSRIYMFRMVSLRNPWISCRFFPAPSGAPSGGKHFLEMKYPYPRSLCHVVSEYLVKMVYFQNPWSGCLFFLHLQEHLQEGGALWKLKILTQVP